MSIGLRQLVRSRLPIRLALGPGGPETRVFVTLGLQRSGQHLVIDWICRGMGEAVHLNFCWPHRRGLSLVMLPQNGRHVVYRAGEGTEAFNRENVWEAEAHAWADLHLYSVEDYDADAPELRKTLADYADLSVLILRDPYNWLASSLRHGLSDEDRLRDKVAFLKGHLRRAVEDDPAFDLYVDSNRFVADAEYRAGIAGQLGVADLDRAEDALGSVPGFGGGSSFSGTQRPSSHALERRWEAYTDDPFFRGQASDPEIFRLARLFFGERPHFADVRDALGLQ